MAYTTDEHDFWLSEQYFEIVGSVRRYPRYKNKRCMDPFIRMFLDENNLELPKGWGLPVPNEEAAYKSLAKYGKDILPMSQEDVSLMNKAWNFAVRHFGVYMQESKVLPLADAKQRMDMSTSTGVPFSNLFKTKKELFEGDSEIDCWLEKDWELLAQDPNWTCCFVNSLKEELRLEEKILENSMRTFLAGSLDATAHGTRLFADMNEKLYSAYLVSASAIGMSPYGGNWNRMVRKLKIFPNGYALDESQYDSSLRAYLMWGCAWLRWQMLAEVDRTSANLMRIKTYYRNLVSTLVVTPEGNLVMKKTGNPSGSVNTISDNTIILYVLLAFAWLKMCPREMGTYDAFEAHTSKALVGDDNTWTVSDEAHEFFSGPTVIQCWKALGITTTTDSLKPRKAEELDFLSARTVFLDGLAVPLYDREKLLSSLLYAPILHHTPATTLERVAAMLSVGWTDLVFRSFCRKMIAWLMEEYDPILAEDPHWMQGKAQIQVDSRYKALFLGKTILHPQFLGSTVKLTQPRNAIMSAPQPERMARNKKVRRARRRAPTQQPCCVQVTPRRRKPRRGKQLAPVAPAITGTGAYQKVKGKYRKGFGPDYGSRLGSTIGEGMQSLAEVFGFGDYTIKSNTLLNTINWGTDPPSVMNTGKGEATLIRHREYLGDLLSGANGGAGTSVFSLKPFKINPGNTLLFPWLADIATNYQEWELMGMIFELKTLSSNYAAGLAMGAMFAATQYDVLHPQPANKVELENLEYAVSNKPSLSTIMPIECARSNDVLTHLYIAQNGEYEGGDARFSDLGQIFVGSFGIPVFNSPIAEMWVSYDVALYKPILREQGLANISSLYKLNGVDATNSFGTSQSRSTRSSNLIGAAFSPNGVTLTFPEQARSYLVFYYINNNATPNWGITPPIVSYGSPIGMVGFPLFQNFNGVMSNVLAAPGASNPLDTYYVFAWAGTVSGPSPTVPFSVAITTTGLAAGTLAVLEIPSTLAFPSPVEAIPDTTLETLRLEILLRMQKELRALDDLAPSHPKSSSSSSSSEEVCVSKKEHKTRHKIPC